MVRMPPTPRPLRATWTAGAALLLLPGLGACEGWPRYAHLPASGDPDALAAGSDPGLDGGTSWEGPLDEGEKDSNSGLPIGTVRALDIGQGLWIQGELSGSGWTDEAADLEGSCGSLAFPPGAQGGYTGDVDWVGVMAATDGLLCAQLEISPDSLQFDLVPYLLDVCEEPVTALLDPGGAIVGIDQAAPQAAWSVPVLAGQSVGVALAAFWPSDDTLRAPWSLSLALVEASPCPASPELE